MTDYPEFGELPGAEPDVSALPSDLPTFEPAGFDTPLAPPPSPGEAPTTTQSYTVQSGDTLWDIAERHYGDGAMYPLIAEASGIDNPDLIHPGQVLTLPETPAPESPAPSPAPEPAVPAPEPSSLPSGSAEPFAAPAGNPFATPDEPGARPELTVQPGSDTLVPGMIPIATPMADPDTAEFNAQPASNPDEHSLTAPAFSDPGPAGPDSPPEWVPEDLKLGDHRDWSKHWFQQAENGNCVPASVAQIVSEYTGETFSDEQAFVDLAEKLGLFEGGDNNNGMTPVNAAKLLNAAGVPAELHEARLPELAQAVDEGRGVMVFVDSGEYWAPATELVEDNRMDHCVVISEIDLEREVVYLSDPGHPDGDAIQMPLAQFADAWSDSGNKMIVCDTPSPNFDHGDDRLSNVLDNIESQARDAVPDPLAAAVHRLTQNPWILLPVVLGAGALGAAAVARRRNAERYES